MRALAEPQSCVAAFSPVGSLLFLRVESPCPGATEFPTPWSVCHLFVSGKQFITYILISNSLAMGIWSAHTLAIYILNVCMKRGHLQKRVANDLINSKESLINPQVNDWLQGQSIHLWIRISYHFLWITVNFHFCKVVYFPWKVL